MALAPGRVMPALPADRSSKGDKKEYFGGKTGVSMALALVAHGSPFFGSCVRLRFQRAGQQKLDGEGWGGQAGLCGGSCPRAPRLCPLLGRRGGRMGARSDSMKRGLLGAVKYA